MKWISGLKPRFENHVQIWKWKTRKWEADFQVYFKKSNNNDDTLDEEDVDAANTGLHDLFIILKPILVAFGANSSIKGVVTTLGMKKALNLMLKRVTMTVASVFIY